MLLLDETLSLAAFERRSRVLKQRATWACKNRVWGFSATGSGRISLCRPLRRRTAIGYRGCWYKTALGRAQWLSRDPLGEEGGINLYGYVGNNPINEIDPLGLEPGAIPGITTPIASGRADMVFVRGIPPNSQMFIAPNGQSFFAPEGVDFQKVYDAGKAVGLNPFGVNPAVGHYGKYDFQRNRGDGFKCPPNTFYPGYTDASNYAVGTFMQGAGYSLSQTKTIAGGFAKMFSRNAGDPQQAKWWSNGYNAAQTGDPNGITFRAQVGVR